MGLDKRFRVSELTLSGSKAIRSENEDGEHTFIISSPEGDNDGETFGYVEKPTYNVNELKRALDFDVNELFVPPVSDLPDVVPLDTYERLQEEFATASLENISSSILIDDLRSTGSQLSAASASLAILYEQSQEDYNMLVEDFTETSEELQGLQIEFGELEQYSKELETVIENNLENIERTLERADEQLQELPELRGQVNSMLLALSQVQFEGVRARADALEKQLESNKQKVESTTEGIRSVRQGLSSVRSSFSNSIRGIRGSIQNAINFIRRR